LSFVIHFFALPLNQIVILGFPLGFYMAAQGSLIADVILIFWLAKAVSLQSSEVHRAAKP
jgi:putative solute:sodium symporter small subunit